MQLSTQILNCKTLGKNETAIIYSYFGPIVYIYLMLNILEKNKMWQVWKAVIIDVIFMVNKTPNIPCSHATNGTNNSIIYDICGKRNTGSAILTCNK